MDSTELSAAIPSEASAQATPKDLVLLIFIHGFKGTDSTFGEFPQRLQHVLSESLKETSVESIIFPAYETKGELNAAVVRFADWLTELTVQREVANGGAGRAKIVLCGHSMGGLLAADALIEFVQTRPDKLAPLWPNIIACIAYDTPYLGLHPHVFKNSATQAAEYVRTATNVLNSFKTWRSKTPSGAAAAAAAADVPPPLPPKGAITAPPAAEPTGAGAMWQKWAAPAAYTFGGALFAGAAAGAAYYKRDDIGIGYAWVTDHLKYVGNLWNKDELEQRLNKLFQTESTMGVLFQTFYTSLPPSPPNFPAERTFAVLPSRNSHAGTHFAPNRNTVAADEVQAHIGIFDAKTNDGYYDLGLSSAKLIREAVLRHRLAEDAAAKQAATSRQVEEVKEAVHSSETAQQAEVVAGAAAAAPAPAAIEVAAPPQPAHPVVEPPPPEQAQAEPTIVVGEDEESEEEEEEDEEEEEEEEEDDDDEEEDEDEEEEEDDDDDEEEEEEEEETNESAPKKA